jgi:hypothetical protein
METIQINLVFPGTGIRRMSVRKVDQVSVLSAALQRFDCDLVHKGQVVDRQLTFQCYNVQNGDSIVVLTQAAPTRDRWLRITTDDDDFDLMMQSAANIKCRSEFLRLRDIRRTRMESNPTKFRRICTRIPNIIDGIRAPSVETVIPDPATEMRDDPLPPLLWS